MTPARAAAARWLGAGAVAALAAVLALNEVWPAKSARLARGTDLYARHCAACHGERLQGQPDWRRRLPNGRLPAPPHDASGHTWHHADALLFGIVKHGMTPYAGPNYQSDMSAFAGALSDDEIGAVLEFIKSRWPPRERDYQELATRQAK